METQTGMKDLGYSNGWRGLPPEVTLCRVLGHKEHRKTINQNGTLDKHWCPVCQIQWLTDSSD